MENQFENRSPIYDKNGRVNDPEVAQTGAEVENKYRKKLFGFIKRSKSHIEEGKLEAEMAMENTKTINRADLPTCVIREFFNYIKEIEKDNNRNIDPEDADEIEIENSTVGDLGGGVKRYRLSCEDIGMAAIIGGIIIPEHDRLMFIIDVKDETIINSNIILD